MTKPNLSNFFNTVRSAMVKHSPGILTGIGVAGMAGAAVLAAGATPKALRLCEQLRDEHEQEPTKFEYVKACWKCYIPAFITGTLSAACIIGANSVNTKRNAALAAAYTLSDTALREYREKVVETIGEKKEQAVYDKISEEKIKSNPIENNQIILTERGNTLCLDPISGRYFKSDMDKIKRAENKLNARIVSSPFNDGVSLNELYEEIGLSRTTNGDDLGWNLDIGMIDIYLSAQMAEEGTPYEGTPCIVMNYKNPPKYGF